MPQFSTFVGIDVDKFTLAIFVEPTSTYFELPNNSNGHQKLVARLSKITRNRDHLLIAVEPTGGHEWAIWQTLDEAGFHVRQVPAAHIRHFARSQSTLAKTDPLDARSIARFIAFRPDAGRNLPDKPLEISML